jgi:cell division protein FtsL
MKMPGRRALLFVLPLLWLAVLASAAGAVFVKHRARELFVELETVNRERDRLEIEWGQLQLEQSAWSTHAFVENVAVSNLGMRTPPPKQIEIVAP